MRVSSTGQALVLRGDARALPLPDASVDLVVTSPPYFNLREYQDGGQPLAGQIGAESTPSAYIDALLECTAEWARVLKPTGSIFVNLADCYANSATPERVGSSDGATSRADRPGRRSSAGSGVRPKSLYGLPSRYLIGCIDKLGLIARRDIVWHKTTALPESVTDRCATRHEYVFHLTKEERYYAGVDHIRGPSAPQAGQAGTFARKRPSHTLAPGQAATQHRTDRPDVPAYHPLGRLPGSVWSIAGEPLTAPDHLGITHSAAYPTELVRRIILGWSPSGWCTACGQPRRPAIIRGDAATASGHPTRRIPGAGRHPLSRHGEPGSTLRLARPVAILGESCGCPEPTAPTRPSAVLDPFAGTGTTMLVASALGRIGVGVDRSADYCRLATWRTTDPGQIAKALGVPRPPVELDGQLDLLSDMGGGLS